jgi:hypothetical protein
VISFPRRVEKRFDTIVSVGTASAKLTLGDCLS